MIRRFPGIVFHRVRQEVQQRFIHGIGVGPDEQRGTARGELHLHSTAFRNRLHQTKDRPDHGTEVDRFHGRLDRPPARCGRNPGWS